MNIDNELISKNEIKSLGILIYTGTGSTSAIYSS